MKSRHWEQVLIYLIVGQIDVPQMFAARDSFDLF